MNSGSRPFYRAVARSLLSRYAVYAANLGSLMMLARTFTPDAFGVVASVSVICAFFQLMAEGGLAPAIINLTELAPRDRDGIFGLTLLVGIGLAAAFLAVGPLLESFYGTALVAKVVPYSAAVLFFNAIAILPAALLLREQRFSSMAAAGVVAEVASTLAALSGSRIMDPLSALAMKSALSAIISSTALLHFAGRTEFGRPQPGRHFSAIRTVSRAAGYQLGANFATYLSRNMDNVLVGKYLGSTALGAYDKAYQLMRYPLMLLTFAMTPAIQPVVRRYVGDSQRVEAIHRDFTFKLSLAGAVAALCIWLLAEQITLVVLGGQWVAVVPLIRVLAVSIPAQVVLSTNGSFFQAMGRPDLMFSTGMRSAMVMLLAIVVGIASHDLVKLSWALVAAFNINFIQTYYVMYAEVFCRNCRSFCLKMIPAGVAMTVMIVLH